MDALLWLLNIAWKLMLLIIGWKTIRYVTKNCGGTFQEVLNTIGLCLKAGCTILRDKALKRLSTARKQETQTENQALDEKSDAVKVEATVV